MRPTRQRTSADSATAVGDRTSARASSSITAPATATPTTKKRIGRPRRAISATRPRPTAAPKAALLPLMWAVKMPNSARYPTTSTNPATAARTTARSAFSAGPALVVAAFSTPRRSIPWPVRTTAGGFGVGPPGQPQPEDDADDQPRRDGTASPEPLRADAGAHRPVPADATLAGLPSGGAQEVG